MKRKGPKNISEVTMDVRVAENAVGGELIDPAEVNGRLSCSKIHLSANADFDRHIHSSDHLLIILEGDGFLSYYKKGGEIRMIFKAGDVFPVPRNLLHAVTAGPNGTTFLAIGTPARTLRDPKRMKFV